LRYGRKGSGYGRVSQTQVHFIPMPSHPRITGETRVSSSTCASHASSRRFCVATCGYAAASGLAARAYSTGRWGDARCRALAAIAWRTN
jgi:hypothetical protein